MLCLKRTNFLFDRYFTTIRMQSTVTNVLINHDQKANPDFQKILTDDALTFLKQLHLKFNDRRKELLELRLKRKDDLKTGRKLGFLETTKHIREDKSWKIGPLPPDLQKRHVEITGPVDRKMVINALNSGADCFMAGECLLVRVTLDECWVNGCNHNCIKMLINFLTFLI